MPSRLLPLAMAAGAVLSLAAACGGDSDAPATSKASVAATTGTALAGTATGAAPAAKLLAGPAKKYSLNQDDLGTGFITDIGGSKEFDIESLGAEKLFDSAADGKAKLAQWGFVSGYRAGYVPEGRTQTLLNGGYAVSIDSYLFANEAGAKSAYEHIDKRVTGNGAKVVSTAPVGDQSVTRLAVPDKLPSSNTNRAIHQMIMRRSNLLVVVQTIGAEPFMRSDTVVALAGIVDQKALGKRPLVEPTPLSNYTPPVYPTRSATAAPTASAQGR